GVKPGLIRVDADEVTYPLHVILRYRLERALIEGQLETQDIPGFWDDAMQRALGLSTQGNFRDGCMQDVHWPSGAFGYFPSYTLGALSAAQLFAAAVRKEPNIPGEIALGSFERLNGFLREAVWSQASLLTSGELMRQAHGAPPD